MTVDFVVQSLAAFLLFTGLWLTGNKRLLGPFVTLIADIFNGYVGITHHVWCITLISSVRFVIQGRNFVKWYRERTGW